MYSNDNSWQKKKREIRFATYLVYDNTSERADTSINSDKTRQVKNKLMSLLKADQVT